MEQFAQKKPNQRVKLELDFDPRRAYFLAFTDRENKSFPLCSWLALCAATDVCV